MTGDLSSTKRVSLCTVPDPRHQEHVPLSQAQNEWQKGSPLRNIPNACDQDIMLWEEWQVYVPDPMPPTGFALG
eukprot:12918414-Prorocentrum_lima.AAC.1